MNQQKKWVVVIPTCREAQLKEFLTSFSFLFKTHVEHIIVIEDNPTKTFNIEEFVKNDIGLPPVSHFCWEDIERRLGENAWIIPRRTDCIRSFGFLVAHELTTTPYILTLDDDVRYNNVDIFTAYEWGFNAQVQNAVMYDTTHLDCPISPRGFPFRDRHASPIMLQWGMWEGVPDLDGVTQLQHPINDYKIPESKRLILEVISKGQGVTGCIMNCAFRREVIPAMYQLLMGQDKDGNYWPYDRWGDIWSGHIAKKYVEDVLGGAVAINYAAHVKHERASNVYTNIQKELSGYEVNEHFWERLAPNYIASGPYLIEVLRELRIFDVVPTSGATDKYCEAMTIWQSILKQ